MYTDLEIIKKQITIDSWIIMSGVIAIGVHSCQNKVIKSFTSFYGREKAMYKDKLIKQI